MVKIGGGQVPQSQEAKKEDAPWYKQNLSLVDPNADSWFESFEPKHASEMHREPLAAMGKVAGLLSYVAASDLKLVEAFEVSRNDLGSPLQIPNTEFGKELLNILEQEQVDVTYKSNWAETHERFEELGTKKRLQGQWATEAGTPFLQYLEIHNGKDGQEVAYWFVDLLVTPVHIEGVNHFEFESDDKDGSISTYTLNPESGGFSLGELSTKLALPVFLKQLAFMSETPFPSTQIMTMSRDLTFSGVPDEARPVPFFTIKNYSEATGFSKLQTSRNSGESNAYEGTIFPQVVQFGWRLSNKSIPHLSQLLPVIVNGCASAMTTVEDGYINFRSPDFSAPWDDAVGSPCSKLFEGSSRTSRAGAPQWIPVTQIGDLLVRTKDMFLESIEDQKQGRPEAALEKLQRVVEDGAGPFLVHGINSLIYSYLIPELAQKPDLISEIDYLSKQAVDQMMEGQSTNAISNLGIAYFKLKDLDASSNAFLTALDMPDRYAEAEASFFMRLIERERDNLELAEKYEERCRLAGGYAPGAGLLDQSSTAGEKLAPIEPSSNHFLNSSQETEGLVAEPSEISAKLNLHEIFPAIPENSIIRQLVSNFGSKLKLAQTLSSSSFEGGQDSSDSYHVLLKLALLYSAIEGWERLTGKGLFVVSDQELSELLASDPAWKHFRERLMSVTSGPKLKTSLQAFYDRETSDLIPLLTAIRHGFFHPGLTATNSTLVAKPKLRELLLRTYARVEGALIESFEGWASKMESWHDLLSAGDDELMETAIGLDLAAGYPRAAVETEFRTKLTEQQWRILISELWAEDEFDVEATITDVMSNLASFEAEYKAWNEQIANRRNDSDGD
jgi:tetratricopeptide (TPR) repeat protein